MRAFAAGTGIRVGTAANVERIKPVAYSPAISRGAQDGDGQHHEVEAAGDDLGAVHLLDAPGQGGVSVSNGRRARDTLEDSENGSLGD